MEGQLERLTIQSRDRIAAAKQVRFGETRRQTSFFTGEESIITTPKLNFAPRSLYSGTPLSDERSSFLNNNDSFEETVRGMPLSNTTFARDKFHWTKKKSADNAYGRRYRELRVRGYWQAVVVKPRKLAFVDRESRRSKAVRGESGKKEKKRERKRENREKGARSGRKKERKIAMKVGEEKKREREQKRGGAAGALERTPFFHGGLRLRMALYPGPS